MTRRDLLKYTTYSLATVGVVSSTYHYIRNENYMPSIKSFIKNPVLEDILTHDKWLGTPLDQNGLFVNEKDVFWPKFSDVLKWKFSSNEYKAVKEKDTSKLRVIKYKSPDVIPDNTMVWLGHASFLLHVNGLRILIDPVFGSPQFLKRCCEEAFEPTSLTNVDYILLSHNHRDHCDKDSVKLLASLNQNATWLCGLKLEQVLQRWADIKHIQAAGWYQRYNTTDIKVSFLPTRHWSRRGLSDTNETLWGAFLIEANGKKIYFGGDSGYGDHVARVRAIFGNIDYYLAGIGAFAPRWFMGPSHMHPEEVAQTTNELMPVNLLPMHYGTFDLSNEPLLEPAKLIRKLKDEHAFGCNLVIPSVGEIIKI